MIVTVTANLALDVTYRLDRLVPNDTHRPRSVNQRAGGKGVNVARVLHRLGQECLVVGPAGGATGELIRRDLAAIGLRHDLVPIRGESRRTVTLVSADDGGATLVNEPGPTLSEHEWRALVELVDRASARASAVVLAGSLPQAAPKDGYAQLVGIAAAHGVPTVLDSSGHDLSQGARAGPDIVKPNAAELHDLTGTEDPFEGAVALRELGAKSVVVSLGPTGLLAVTGRNAWRAAPSCEVYGNPTGAGDAAVAALTVGLRDGSAWPERLREAVAVSAAAVAAPLAGDIDDDHRRRERRAVRVRDTLNERKDTHASGAHR